MSIAAICTSILLSVTGPNGQVSTEQGYVCTQPTDTCLSSVTVIKGGKTSHVCTQYGPVPTVAPPAQP